MKKKPIVKLKGTKTSGFTLIIEDQHSYQDIVITYDELVLLNKILKNKLNIK
jgi:hypothetical protein